MIPGWPQGAGRRSSDPVGDREAVEVERRAKVGACCRCVGLERDASRIGDPVDRVKEAHDASGVAKTRRTQRHRQRAARSRQRSFLLAEYGFGKSGEKATIGHSAITLDSTRDRLQLVGLILGLAARTEQQSMTGSSIETPIESGYPRRQ